MKALAEKIAIRVWIQAQKKPLTWTLESMEREILKTLKKETLNNEKNLLRQKRQSKR